MNDLNKERDIIKVWTHSGRTTHKVLYSNKWKRGLGYSEKISKDKEETKTGDANQEEVFIGMRPLSIVVNFVNYEPTFKFQNKPKSNI